MKIEIITIFNKDTACPITIDIGKNDNNVTINLYSKSFFIKIKNSYKQFF